MDVAVMVEWDEIVATNDAKIINAVEKVHHQLIDCSKALGWYYQQ